MNCTLLNDTRETYPLPLKGPVLPDDGMKTVVPCMYYAAMLTHPA